MAGSVMSMQPAVEVLLATYNGERFLREQIESILSQTYVPVRILARDDGSRDGTVRILEEYARKMPERFALMPQSGPTGSPKFNFLRLLEASSAEYVACADQDDVWLPEKIALEMEAMHRLQAEHGTAKPLLVFSDLRVVNDDLTTIAPSYWQYSRVDPRSIGRLPRLLVQNAVTGCTILMNRALAQKSLRMPAGAFMHDWWVALLANVLGAAAFLEEPTVLYRQHTGNVLGAGAPEEMNLIPRFRNHHKRRDTWERAAHMAVALLEVHGDELPPDARRTVEALVRCERSPQRVVRAFTYLRHGFFFPTKRGTLTILWYLWDMDSDKRRFPGTV